MFGRFFGQRRRRNCPRADLTQDGLIPLAHMPVGQRGTVVQIAGGPGLARRLNVLGIRPGSRVTKVSSMFMRGPVTVRVGQTQVAIGFGMARRILVRVD